MTLHVRPGNNDIRIHAIVLTRDRPETLRRCLALALSTLGRDDRLTILDDSPRFGTLSQAAVLGSSRQTEPRCIHLSTVQLQATLRQSARPPGTWLVKTSQRDIAPLRNLSLLLAAAVSATTTILIDDDVCGFDLSATHRRLDALSRTGQGLIVGGHIGGISELDSITRLAQAIDTLRKLPAGVKVESPRQLFQVSAVGLPDTDSACCYVSGGYLAFRLPPRELIAFPPGYNEDWLWCLLHRGHPQVRIIRSAEVVVHEPPALRRPTREDLSFELQGDLVFDCLQAQAVSPALSTADVLTRLAVDPPCLDWMPAPRAAELIAEAREARLNGTLPLLEPYGLALMEEMLRLGEFNWEGERVLADWSRDALAKHQAFTATLRDEVTISTIRTLMQRQEAVNGNHS